jgi:hypothetical protein
MFISVSGGFADPTSFPVLSRYLILRIAAFALVGGGAFEGEYVYSIVIVLPSEYGLDTLAVNF